MIQGNVRILVLATGGTISQVHDETGITIQSDSASFKTCIKDIKERLNDNSKRYGETLFIKDIIVDEVINKDGSNVIPEDWTLLSEKIKNNYNEYDAFIITHGTNTLGYTSAALSFSLTNLSKPVILTGAQVSYGFPGSDAQLNLENAIRIAAYKERIIGVTVVFGSIIITGTRVKKTNEFDYDTFKAFNTLNTIARIGNSVRINRDALENHLQKWSKIGSAELILENIFDMRIASLTEYPGMDSNLFISLIQNDIYPVKGIILRATGAGDPNVADPTAKYQNLRYAFDTLKDQQIPIVVTTQAPNGIATMDINTPGKLALELGAIPARDMSMESMTVKLAWLLGKKTPYGKIKDIMGTSIRGEIN